MPRYIIYGAGGIGGAIGASLYQHGFEVVLIARGEHLRQIQDHGLFFRRPQGDTRLALSSVREPREIGFRGDEVVFFCMKSQDTLEALLALRDVAGSSVPVVMCQNGVANERMALRFFQRVYAMLVYMPTTHLEPGVVCAEGETFIGVLDAGVYPTGVDDTIRRICADLTEANFSSAPDPQVMRIKHAKLLVNLGNALQALCGLEADTKAIIKALRKEAMHCFDMAGIEYLSVGEMRARHAGIIEYGEIAGTSRGGGSSWQSMMRGTGSIEADYLNGEIVLLGKQNRVNTPYNSALRDLATRAAKEGRPPGSVSLDELLAYMEQQV